MKYTCDICKRNVGTIRRDLYEKLWMCDKCYWNKELNKSDKQTTIHNLEPVK